MRYFELRQNLFVGRVTDVRQINVRLFGCSMGPSWMAHSAEYSVRIDRVLHGCLLPATVRLRSYHHLNAQDALGRRVFAWGNRLCEDHWMLWGDLIPTDSAGTFLPTESVWPHELDPELGGPATLQAIEDSLDAAASISPWTALHGFRSLHLVVITSITRHPGTWPDLACAPIVQVFGGPTTAASRVGFAPPEGAACDEFSVGDTLLLPDAESDGRATRLYAGCPETFLVRNGELGAWGIPLSEVRGVIRRLPGPDQLAEIPQRAAR